ncbi:nuclear transport factor 2 family protein [Lysobacter terrae]
MKALSLLLCCLLPLAVHASETTSSREASAKKEIEAVVETFRTAIIARDKERFTQLFLHDGTTWQRVLSDEGLRRVREKNPQATKVRVNPESTYRTFIEGIAANEKSSEETFENVRIDTDGDIASVWFDYSFKSDGRRTNYGKEAWHLVNTEGGWKIVSVVWSVIPVPPESPPKPAR